VDPDDPAFSQPSKPVGPFYTEKDVAALRTRFPKWQIIEDAGRGYRRIVPSPEPKRIIQSRMIRALVYAGNVVLALGGGGVPMTKDANDRYRGVEAVIDKDLSSALLARDIKADLFVILTGQEKVSLRFGTLQQTALGTITCSEAERYMAEGHFPPGSMGPKITAAINYLKSGGRRVIVTNPDTLSQALDGDGGTQIVWG
jgi:carbamate kinase